MAALLSACTSTPQQEAPPTPKSEMPAVQGLLDSARADIDAGRLDKATASLERALRIEPRNPWLWQELARVHLRQGNYAQAESFAARSNSWAAGDKTLQSVNWHLIGEARARRGDGEGAFAAFEREKALAP
jgi:cytochrome c-type biogenesis protein CcmH/NrfG